MDRRAFRKLVTSRIVLMDGATGSNLLKRGMPPGVCCEEWIAKNPGIISQLQKEYAKAGSDIILAPTFGANRPVLSEHGLESEVVDLNKKLVEISRSANPDALIAGDVSMTGLMTEPMGETTFEELIDIYKEQIGALAEAGVDLLDIETMINLADARAAVIAAKECTDLPVMVTMSFNENGMTMYGNGPDAAIISLQDLDVDAVGINCSAGPDKVLPIVKKMKRFAKVPLIVKPNAGLPLADNEGNSVYSMEPEEFAGFFEEILKCGVHIIGGCCGTAPEYIEALHSAYADFKVSESVYEVEFPEAMIATSRMGAFVSEAEDIEEFDCDRYELHAIVDEINELQSDFLRITGSDEKKRALARRVYNGVAL